MGGASAREARRALRARGVASYDAPAAAAAAVGHLTEWGRAQAALLHVPDRGAETGSGAAAQARARADAVLRAVARAGPARPERARGDGGARRLRHPGAPTMRRARHPRRTSARAPRQCSPTAGGSW